MAEIYFSKGFQYVPGGCLKKTLGIFLLSLGAFAAQAAGPARARWVDSAHVVLKLPPGLHMFGGMRFTLADTLTPLAPGANAFDLPVLSDSGNYISLSTSQLGREILDQALQRPLRIFITNADNQILDSTALQYAGVLDELYFYNGHDLGAVVGRDQISLKVWAPTAQKIKLRLYRDPAAPVDAYDAILPMERVRGVWQTKLAANFVNSYYLYEVSVYQPAEDRVVTSLVTDPYSRALSLNATKSQILDPEANEAKPPGWDSVAKPALNSMKDSVLYELHIRDFSAGDESVSPEARGTYLAFTEKQSQGMKHLRALAQAGLTHVHLLPFQDFGSVNEDKSTWQNYRGGGDHLEEPQSIVGRQRSVDAYNWGYDPVHFFSPDGSYAVHADGAERLRETRAMIAALNETNLRVVMDVVYNHTYHNGLVEASVFDKIVPLYYYRTDDEGTVFNSSCCADTATEHRMMEKLMIDSVLYWAREFKVDGFRFDLMSFHSHETMVHLREAVRALTLARDGVDGRHVLLYGEGWNFGSLYNQKPQDAMTMGSSYGLSYGFFNDRLRDAVRGGTTHSDEKSDQGFATGLYFDFNQEPANHNTSPDLSQQEGKLLYLGDIIKVGLSGNLRDYSFRSQSGVTLRGGDLSFRGQPVGTAAQAMETVNYVSAHDGYCLWDTIQAKAPYYTPGRSPRVATSEERQRMLQLSLAIPMLGQGVPFIEAGSEMMRTKNGDQDSYDSGDYFNHIDWSGQGNNWGGGLPPAWKNLDDWSFWKPRLEEPALKTTPELIARTEAYFEALLRLRQSSPLFKLNDAGEISRALSFIDNDSKVEPGLIAMSLRGSGSSLLIFFNSSRAGREFSHPLLRGNWKLHPLFNANIDPALSQTRLDTHAGHVYIPGVSTLVLTSEGSRP